MTAALEGGEWSAARPGRTLPPGKTRYPFYRRLGGPLGWSERAEYLVPTGIRSRTVQPVVSHYTDWATRSTISASSWFYYENIFYLLVLIIFILFASYNPHYYMAKKWNFVNIIKALTASLFALKPLVQLLICYINQRRTTVYLETLTGLNNPKVLRYFCYVFRGYKSTVYPVRIIQ